jgi:hypothetical protein
MASPTPPLFGQSSVMMRASPMLRYQRVESDPLDHF